MMRLLRAFVGNVMTRKHSRHKMTLQRKVGHADGDFLNLRELTGWNHGAIHALNFEEVDLCALRVELTSTGPRLDRLPPW